MIARDHAYRDAAVKYITEDPVRFVKLAGLKFTRFWRLWPFAEDYRTPLYVVGSIVSFVPVLILAIVYLVFFSGGHFVRIFPLLLFIGYLTAVHMIMVGSIRYRLPLEPFLIVFAAAAVTRLIGRFDRSRERRGRCPITKRKNRPSTGAYTQARNAEHHTTDRFVRLGPLVRRNLRLLRKTPTSRVARQS